MSDETSTIRSKINNKPIIYHLHYTFLWNLNMLVKFFQVFNIVHFSVTNNYKIELYVGYCN